MDKTCFCPFKGLSHSEILLPTFPHWQQATVYGGSLCALQRAPVQTQMMQALLPSLGDWLSWLDDQQLPISRTGACLQHLCKKVDLPTWNFKRGHKWCDCPEHRGQSSLCSAASALGQPWKRFSYKEINFDILEFFCHLDSCMHFVRRSSHRNVCLGKSCFCLKLWRCW